MESQHFPILIGGKRGRASTNFNYHVTGSPGYFLCASVTFCPGKPAGTRVLWTVPRTGASTETAYATRGRATCSCTALEPHSQDCQDYYAIATVLDTCTPTVHPGAQQFAQRAEFTGMGELTGSFPTAKPGVRKRASHATKIARFRTRFLRGNVTECQNVFAFVPGNTKVKKSDELVAAA